MAKQQLDENEIKLKKLYNTLFVICDAEKNQNPEVFEKLIKNTKGELLKARLISGEQNFYNVFAQKIVKNLSEQELLGIEDIAISNTLNHTGYFELVDLQNAEEHVQNRVAVNTKVVMLCNNEVAQRRFDCERLFESIICDECLFEG